MEEEGTDLNVAFHRLDTVQGPLSINDDERYAVYTVRSGSLDHFFYTIQSFCGL